MADLAREGILCNVVRSNPTWGGMFRPRVISISCFFVNNLPSDFLRNISTFSFTRSIQLIGCDLSQSHFSDIDTNDSIKSLQVQMCPLVDDKCLLLICKNMPSLVKLNLSGTAITDAGTKHVSQLRHLEQLDLSRTQITGECLDLVTQNCPKLKNLDFQRSRLTDTGLAALTDCQSLEILNLAWTDVTEHGVSQLTPLTQLRSLTIWDTPMAQTTVEELKRSLSKTRITIGRN
ncbi:MAG: hypothetical protein AAF497_00885 [Planctomycetota bacterium]